MPEEDNPIHGDELVALRVMDDVVKRVGVGIKTYGHPLRTFNNTNALRNLKEELLDALFYIEQLIMELESERGKYVRILRERLSVEEMETMAFDYFRLGVYLNWTPEMNADRRRIMLVEYAFNRGQQKLLHDCILAINAKAFWGENGENSDQVPVS